VNPAAYYNEWEPYPAQWLRNLIARNLIAPGDVDERSITDVHPDDLRGYTQCHFFAGLGGWSHALRLAGRPDDRSVWTGSCPCQPFSAAGSQRGSDDERHLWPAFFRLIRECRPARVLGEQVAGAAGYAWFDHVAADLEGEGYAAAACDLGAHSVGAPHLRQRLYWVADADSQQRRAACGQPDAWANWRNDAGGRGALCGMADAAQQQREWAGPRASTRVADVANDCVMGHPNAAGLAQRVGDGCVQRNSVGARAGQAAVGRSHADPWADLAWLPCSDSKARPTQPGLFPLAHGVPARVGRLRAYGNAIVPQVAAEFIGAVMDCRP